MVKLFEIITTTCVVQGGQTIGTLLGVDGVDLYRNLCKPKIKVGGEFVVQGRSAEQVSYSMGAISKGLYDRLFKYLVSKCNETLETGLKRSHFIGVLDIAGFEIFDVSRQFLYALKWTMNIYEIKSVYKK